MITNADVDIKQNPEGGVIVPGLSNVEVQSVEDVVKVVGGGQKNRAVSQTMMNDQSSRSHAVLRISVSGKNQAIANSPQLNATLNLIDLAGSERISKSGASQEQITEAVRIL
jgi:hypothetical protein